MHTSIVVSKKTLSFARIFEPSSALEDGDETHFDRAREFAGCVWKAAG